MSTGLTADGRLSIAFSPMTIIPEGMITVDSVRTLPDGRTESTFSDGTVVTASPDGRRVTVVGPNGEMTTTTIHPDGSTTRTTADGTATTTSADGRTTTILNPDGTSSSMHINDNGSVSITGPDGSMTTLQPTRNRNGSTTVTLPDGTEIHTLGGGTTITVSADGNTITTAEADGTVTTVTQHDDGSLSTIIQNPDGSRVASVVAADGTVSVNFYPALPVSAANPAGAAAGFVGAGSGSGSTIGRMMRRPARIPLATMNPTNAPTLSPTSEPTQHPTTEPTSTPTATPTEMPTQHACDSGENQCDTMSTYCALSGSGYTCACLEGFTSPAAAASATTLSWNAASTCGMECGTPRELNAITMEECPIDEGAGLADCDSCSLAYGDLCNAGGECATDAGLSNCGTFAVYRITAGQSPQTTCDSTLSPTAMPTYSPTFTPTEEPTPLPSNVPTNMPTLAPCDGGTHDCDLLTTYCAPDGYSFACLCMEGYVTAPVATVDSTPSTCGSECHESRALSPVPDCPVENGVNLPPCDSCTLTYGDLCSATGECETDLELDNCGNFNIYVVSMQVPRLPQHTPQVAWRPWHRQTCLPLCQPMHLLTCQRVNQPHRRLLVQRRSRCAQTEWTMLATLSALTAC